MKITIRTTQHTDGTRAVYRGDSLIATISNEKPNRCNNRPARYGVHRLTGRTDWFDTYSEARDDAMKG